MENFKFYVSLGKHARDNAPKGADLSWNEFVADCSAPTTHGTLPLAEYLSADRPTKMKEKDGPYFIPARFGKSSRLTEDVEEIYAFVCDFDSGAVTSDIIYEKLKKFTYVAWTSYSNSIEKPKWRVVIPYSHPCKPAEHKNVFEYFQREFGGELDPRCGTTQQLWYLPRCPVDADQYFRCLSNLVEGLFDPTGFGTIEVDEPARLQAPGTASPPKASLDDLVEVLTHIEAKNWKEGTRYSQFLNVSMAVHFETKGSEQGFKLWNAWCQDNNEAWEGRERPGSGEESQEYKWDSFGKHPVAKPLTIGTLYRLAKEQGWVPTAKPVPTQAMDPIIARLNDEIFLAPIGNAVCIWQKNDEEGYTPRKVSGMYTLYENQKISFGKPKKDGSQGEISVFKYWLQHSSRRDYAGVTFAPQGCDPRYYNLWKGFAVTPKAGDWSLMKQHIKEVICDSDEDNYEYLMNWMAFAVQFPGLVPGVAVVMRGGRGAGKTTLTDALCVLFGEHAVKVSQPNQLTGKFNAHFVKCVLLVGEESLWSGNRADEQVIKDMVTSPTNMIEYKGIDAVQRKSCLHMMFNSNNDWVIPAGHDERRFFVLQVSPRHVQDLPWFEAIYAQLRAGGYGAMLHELLDRSLVGYNVFNVPQTDALRVQKLQSMDTLEEWWYQKLLNGKFDTVMVGHSGPEAWGTVPTEVVFQDYVKSVGNVPYGRKTATKVGMFLHKIHQSIQIVKVERGVVPVRAYQLPQLEQCRAEFEDYMRTELNWSTGS